MSPRLPAVDDCECSFPLLGGVCNPFAVRTEYRAADNSVERLALSPVHDEHHFVSYPRVGRTGGRPAFCAVTRKPGRNVRQPLTVRAEPEVQDAVVKLSPLPISHDVFPAFRQTDICQSLPIGAEEGGFSICMSLTVDDHMQVRRPCCEPGVRVPRDPGDPLAVRTEQRFIRPHTGTVLPAIDNNVGFSFGPCGIGKTFTVRTEHRAPDGSVGSLFLSVYYHECPFFRFGFIRHTIPVRAEDRTAIFVHAVGCQPDVVVDFALFPVDNDSMKTFLVLIDHRRVGESATVGTECEEPGRVVLLPWLVVHNNVTRVQIHVGYPTAVGAHHDPPESQARQIMGVYISGYPPSVYKCILYQSGRERRDQLRRSCSCLGARREAGGSHNDKHPKPQHNAIPWAPANHYPYSCQRVCLSKHEIARFRIPSVPSA